MKIKLLGEARMRACRIPHGLTSTSREFCGFRIVQVDRVETPLKHVLSIIHELMFDAIEIIPLINLMKIKFEECLPV